MTSRHLHWVGQILNPDFSRNSSLLYLLFDPSTVSNVLSIKVNPKSSDDKIMCSHSSNGQHTTKTAYLLSRDSFPVDSLLVAPLPLILRIGNLFGGQKYMKCIRFFYVPVQRPTRSVPPIRRPCKPPFCLTGWDDGGNQASGCEWGDDLRVGVLRLDARGGDDCHRLLARAQPGCPAWASLAITTALVFIFEVIGGALDGTSIRERKSRKERESDFGSSGVPPSVTVHHRYKVLSFLPTEEGELATIRTALKPLSRFNVINIEAFITKAIFERGYLVKSFCKLYRVLTHHQQPDVFEQILYLSAKNSQFILPPRGHMIVDQFIGFCKLLRTGQGQEMVTEAQRLERRQKRAKERVSRRRNTPCW
ncbi:hypothetical protein CRG98_042187 [Punica granatum]|uniref:Uncharacterized protein n=1 Tax=Punica granatum TaxID=22663 RepID=A0A2I0I0B0_PUNGR|nr:hypothetical protein CRG98_042187 [Punica granatum]